MIILLDLMGGVALLLWGLHMVRTLALLGVALAGLGFSRRGKLH
jgi:Na+/phosphate symporter